MSHGENRITVVVVNWNRRELLRRCLQSLAEQAGPAFEVVLVDNGSSDDSVAMAEAEFSSGPFALSVIRNTVNRGFCAANNQGIAAAGGDLIALLNNDAEANPGWLAALAAVFQRDSDVGMAASKILVWEDPRRIDKAGHLIFPDGQNRGRGSGQLDVGQFDVEEEVLWPDGCAAMYRRAMLDQIGGFDEDFFAYADDAELGLRARIAGWKCIYTPAAVVRHHRGSTLGLLSPRRLELIERNRILLVAKLFPWSLVWVSGAWFAARIAAGALAALRGQGEAARFRGFSGKIAIAKALIKANLEAWTLIPRMLRKRSEVGRLRTLSPRQVRRLLLSNRVSLREISHNAI